MSGFAFDVDAALASARSGTGDPATLATDERANAELSQLSQLSQQVNPPNSTLQGRTVAAVAVVAALASPSDLTHRCSVCGQTARFGFGARLRQGEEGQWFCAAHRPQETGTA